MAADSQGKQEETSMKVAVVTDSNSGITQAQAKEMGVYVLPMPFMIDGTEYLEDINLTQKEFYEHLSGDHDVSTSQPSPETILNLWEKLLEEYDAVVHIPMSSGLSSSCQTAKMLADDFDGKVQVADNHRISVTQRRSVQDALDMAAAGMDAEAICKKLEETGLDSTIYITVDTLKYLKKGGKNHTSSSSARNTSPFKTDSDDTGREAGRICEGADDETGAFHDDHGDHPRSGKSV